MSTVNSHSNCGVVHGNQAKNFCEPFKFEPSKMNGLDKICIICRRSCANDRHLGPLMTQNSISAHFNCVLFSPVNPGAESRTENGGIAGVTLRFIRTEAKRASKIRCNYCKKNGANVSCCFDIGGDAGPRYCSRKYHVDCGTMARATFNVSVGRGTVSVCFEHRDAIERVDEPNMVLEQCDAEQTNDEDSESLSDDEYEIADRDFVPAEGGSHLEQPPNEDVQDPLELPVIENKHHVVETNRTDDNAGDASVKDDAVIEISESFGEVKDEIGDENAQSISGSVQAGGNGGHEGNEDDSEIEMYLSYEELKEESDDETAQPISGSVQAGGNAENEGNEDDSEIEMYLSYEELKEESDDETAQPISGSVQADGNAGNEGEELKDEPYDMPRPQEFLDISGDSDCVIVGGYVEDVEVGNDETN